MLRVPKSLVFVAAAMTIAASCTSTHTGTAAGGGAGDNSSPGVTKTAIHVGGIEYKAFFGDAQIGVQARFKRQNDAGGVFGRRLVLDTTIDDNQDATLDLNAAKTLVQQDHEFAILPVMTANLAASDFLAQQQVPFFGWSIEPRWCGNQYGFGFNGNDCDISKLANIGDPIAVQQKLFPDGSAQGKTVALLAEDVNSAITALNSFATLWRQHGARVVLIDTSTPSPPAVVGDYTPYAEKVLNSNGGKGPDMVVTLESVSNTLGMYSKLKALGYKGILQDFTLYDPRLAGSTAGLVTEIQFAPYEEASTNTAVQQMVTDLKAVDPGVVLSQPAAAGYWSADLFIAMLKKAGPNLTRASFMRAANAAFSYDFGGGVGTVRFPDYHSAMAPCQSFVRSNGHSFDVVIPLTCEPLIKNPLLK